MAKVYLFEKKVSTLLSTLFQKNNREATGEKNGAEKCRHNVDKNRQKVDTFLPIFYSRILIFCQKSVEVSKM